MGFGLAAFALKRKPQTTVRDPQAVGADNKLAPAKKQGSVNPAGPGLGGRCSVYQYP